MVEKLEEIESQTILAEDNDCSYRHVNFWYFQKDNSLIKMPLYNTTRDLSHCGTGSRHLTEPVYNQVKSVLYDMIVFLKEFFHYGPTQIKSYPERRLVTHGGIPSRDWLDERFLHPKLNAWELWMAKDVYSILHPKAEILEQYLCCIFRGDKIFIEETKERFNDSLENFVKKHKGFDVSIDTAKNNK